MFNNEHGGECKEEPLPLSSTVQQMVFQTVLFLFVCTLVPVLTYIVGLDVGYFLESFTQQIVPTICLLERWVVMGDQKKDLVFSWVISQIFLLKLVPCWF